MDEIEKQNEELKLLFDSSYKYQIDGNYENAIYEYESVLKYELNKEIKKIIYYNLALCYMNVEEYQTAIYYFNVSNNIIYDINNIWHICLCYLFLKDWNNAANLYYSRYQTESDTSVKFPEFPIEQLYTELDIKDKDIIVMNEQGFGDEIMFSTQIEKLSKIVNSATIKVSKDLLPLFEYLYKFPNINFLSFDTISANDIYMYDGYLAMGDMFMFLYDDGDPISLNLYKENDSEEIGICWKANVKSPNSKNRSINPDYFSNMNNTVSLQYGENGFNPENFLDTFNLIMNMKEVQTIDTSVAHLCGIIGIPTTLIINEYHDWRWRFLNGDYSTFYPNIKIIKI